MIATACKPEHDLTVSWPDTSWFVRRDERGYVCGTVVAIYQFRVPGELVMAGVTEEVDGDGEVDPRSGERIHFGLPSQ